MDDYNDYRGNTPLIAAAADSDIPRIHELLTMYSQAGTLHQQLEESSSNDGFTPLLWACMNADTDAVRLLLAAGADPTNPGRTEELYDHKITPLGVAHERVLEDGSVNQDIIDMLIEARIERNAPTHTTYIRKRRPSVTQRKMEANWAPPHGRKYLQLLNTKKKGGSRHNEHNFTRKKEHESYIYFIGYGGISDILSEFVTCTKYAVKYKRSILFEMGNVYTSTDIKSVFDFSKYPVPVYTDKHMIQELLKGQNVEPPVDLKKYSLKGKICFIGNKPVKRDTPNSAALVFNTEKEYPRDTILIRSGGRKGRPGHELYFFQHVTLHENIIEQYKEFIKKHNIPSSYVAAHLRATDKPLSFEFNISGINKPTSNSIKHGGIDSFIEKYAPMQTYIATDNKRILEELKKKHPSVIHSDVVYKSKRSNNNTRKHGLHRNGADDPQVFINAILELIILAKAKILMPSVGGYTEMAKHLWKHKDVVERMLRS